MMCASSGERLVTTAGGSTAAVARKWAISGPQARNTSICRRETPPRNSDSGLYSMQPSPLRDPDLPAPRLSSFMRARRRPTV